MTQRRFAARLDIQPSWEKDTSFYDVVDKELRRLHAQSWSGASPAPSGATKTDRINVLVDGVFFQLAGTGIARLWASVLRLLVEHQDIHISVLDRGNCPAIPGLKRIQFPRYSGRNSPTDSARINEIAEEIKANVFLSTYYTTPTGIPSVLVVYDMIPEVLGFNLAKPIWREKHTAISFARQYVCISHNTKADLRKLFPQIPDDRVAVAHCGLDRDIFCQTDSESVAVFKNKYNLVKPYYIWVGSRGRKGGYNNARLLFDAVKTFQETDFDVLCTGGERDIDSSFLEGLPAGVVVRRLDLTDDELSLAYSGALALVYPSLYEGFGMPVIEAMACGCPVVTTRMGSLGEVAGDAAIFVTGHDPVELAASLMQVREPAARHRLIAKGLARSADFNWTTMAATLHESIRAATRESFDPNLQSFLLRWAELRTVQRAVDLGYVRRRFKR
jgi:glycosyltransferase involved in cell wall biosynthesis